VCSENTECLGQFAGGFEATSRLKPTHEQTAACFVDESSIEAKAILPFMSCSKDWEQLRSLSKSPVGVTVSNNVFL
jgi:hypothetical protein